MTSKVNATELKELAGKINAERTAILPSLYERKKVLIEGIDGASLTVNQYGATNFSHENITINAKVDPSADKNGTLNLELVELQEELTFDVRKKSRTYPKGMQFFRLYAA